MLGRNTQGVGLLNYQLSSISRLYVTPRPPIERPQNRRFGSPCPVIAVRIWLAELSSISRLSVSVT